LKRCIRELYPEHFSTELTPKKAEVTAFSSRHNGDMEAARQHYESMMLRALTEAWLALKCSGQLTTVYAHKTTLGWSTLVDALRQSGFVVTEAWPLRTEMKARLTALESSALANSIFIVARKRDGASTGSYEENVRPELERIVRERVDTLWKMGITGADLLIAAVGAGLRAFTQYKKVTYDNGEDVPATKFLKEVEGVVHEALLEKLLSGPHMGVAAVDPASRFYVLWRYTYGAAELDAGEAIVFTYGLDVELDNGLSSGNRSLVQKKKNKYRLRDFTERGADKKLGMPDDQDRPALLIDVLHRILWLTEHEPRSLPRFLQDADPDRERLRLVANVLAGPGLKGSTEGQSAPIVTTTAAEQSALGKLLSNWRTLISSDAPLFEAL
jgi:putative DNA methylase